MIKIAGAAIALLVVTTDAQGRIPPSSPARGRRPAITEARTRDRQEMRGRGLSSLTGNAMVLFADGDMAAWNIVIVQPDSHACVADRGTDLDLPGAPGTPA